MADLGQKFSQEELPEHIPFEALPEGDYTAFINDSQKKESQSGNEYLAIEWVIASGEFEGRKVFQNLNLWHDKQSVVMRARSDLGAISRATGVTTFSDSEEFHDIACTITLIQRESEYLGERRIQNEIRGVAPAGSATKTPAKKKTSTKTPPWVKK